MICVFAVNGDVRVSDLVYALVIYALVRVGETGLRKVLNSTSSVSLNPRATDLFRELVGRWMWFKNQTRLDITNALRAVATYANPPRKVQWKAAVSWHFRDHRDFMMNT